LNGEWARAARVLYQCRERVVVVGVGKSGHIGRVGEFMTRTPCAIGAKCLAVEAVKIMGERGISVLIVVEGNFPVGMPHLHELLKNGFA
jgi:arabinose-5-phosphate isomerase